MNNKTNPTLVVPIKSKKQQNVSLIKNTGHSIKIGRKSPKTIIREFFPRP